MNILRQLVAPYRTRKFPEPPNFSLSSTPATELHKHLEKLNTIREHNLNAIHKWGRLFDLWLFVLGLAFLAAILWRIYT